MTAEVLLSDIFRYLLQSTALVLTAALLVWALRVRSARLRLAIWHSVLLGCLALPLLQPAKRAFVVPAPPVFDAAPETLRGTPLRMDRPLTPAKVACLVAAAGSVARWLWLGAGLMRLALRRRRAALLSDTPASILLAERTLGVRAANYIDGTISSPVTFGWLRPVVLLPPSFLTMSQKSQQAVAFHELIHVKRRDWVFTAAEEIIRGLLWFHPAVWWLLSRVQLAREQVVDEAVVRATCDQERYLGALLEIAAIRLEPDLAPAPLFLRKRQLTERVAFLIQGGNMSKKHVYTSVLALSVLLPLAAGLSAWAWPLQGAPQFGDPDSPGVEVKAGLPLLHRTPVEYPADALQAGVSGDVVADLKTNEKGEVYDASVVSGPAALRATVLKSVLNWHYDLSGYRPLPEHFEIAVRFTLPAASPSRMIPVAPPGERNVVLKKIDLSGVPDNLRERVLARINAHEGDILNPMNLLEGFQGIGEVDRHLSAMLRGVGPGQVEVWVQLGPHAPGVIGGVNGGVIGGILSGITSGVPGGITGGLSGTRPMASVPPETGVLRIRVGGGVQAANLISKVQPDYPALAKQARIQGTVRLNALIDRQGRVTNLELSSGHPLLVQVSVDAVKQWIYRPTLVNGEPVEVIAPIDVNFTLSQ